MDARQCSIRLEGQVALTPDVQALCDKIDRSSASEPLMDVLLTVSASVALNKESNVPGRPNLDKKKQVATVQSRVVYCK